jgi:hypothetical protein
VVGRCDWRLPASPDERSSSASCIDPLDKMMVQTTKHNILDHVLLFQWRWDGAMQDLFEMRQLFEGQWPFRDGSARQRSCVRTRLGKATARSSD